MTVYARDYGTPRLQSFDFATVTINVIRNNFGPVFQNTPYSRSISQSTASGTSVFRVTATDADTVCFFLMYYVRTKKEIILTEDAFFFLCF